MRAADRAGPSGSGIRTKYGGILTDIGSHQVDQFLFYTGSTKAEVVSLPGGQRAPQGPSQIPGFRRHDAARQRRLRLRAAGLVYARRAWEPGATGGCSSWAPTATSNCASTPTSPASKGATTCSSWTKQGALYRLQQSDAALRPAVHLRRREPHAYRAGPDAVPARGGVGDPAQKNAKCNALPALRDGVKV
jgi:hypothetical protein